MQFSDVFDFIELKFAGRAGTILSDVLHFGLKEFRNIEDNG